jgi:hypothetical protein
MQVRYRAALHPDRQRAFTVSGYVKDAASGEALIGANVFVKETMRGSATNVYGYYVLNLEPGTYTLAMSYIGYEDWTRTIEVNAGPEDEHRCCAQGHPRQGVRSGGRTDQGEHGWHPDGHRGAGRAEAEHTSCAAR